MVPALQPSPTSQLWIRRCLLLPLPLPRAVIQPPPQLQMEVAVSQQPPRFLLCLLDAVHSPSRHRRCTLQQGERRHGLDPVRWRTSTATTTRLTATQTARPRMKLRQVLELELGLGLGLRQHRPRQTLPLLV